MNAAAGVTALKTIWVDLGNRRTPVRRAS